MYVSFAVVIFLYKQGSQINVKPMSCRRIIDLMRFPTLLFTIHLPSLNLFSLKCVYIHSIQTKTVSQQVPRQIQEYNFILYKYFLLQNKGPWLICSGRSHRCSQPVAVWDLFVGCRTCTKPQIIIGAGQASCTITRPAPAFPKTQDFMACVQIKMFECCGRQEPWMSMPLRKSDLTPVCISDVGCCQGKGSDTFSNKS